MRRSRLLLLLLFLLALATSGSTRADDDVPCDPTSLSAEAAVECDPAAPDAALAPDGAEAAQFLARRLGATSRSVGSGEGARPTPLSPYRALYGAAFLFPRLGLWAQGSGFALGRRSALYDLQGGAALRFGGGVSFTACYRMLGIDLGYDSDVEAADVEPGIAAPFIGVAFDF